MIGLYSKAQGVGFPSTAFSAVSEQWLKDMSYGSTIYTIVLIANLASDTSSDSDQSSLLS